MPKARDGYIGYKYGTEQEAREAVKLASKTYRKTYAKKNPRLRLLNSARSNARNKGVECTISVEDVVIPDVCPLLGIKLEGNSRCRSMPSIDRIDSSVGYVPGNVWVISWLANRMKSDASIEELIKFARGVLSNFDN